MANEQERKLSELDETLIEFGDCIYDEIKDAWSAHCQNFDFETEEDYAPYGDTHVSTGSYITEESENQCRELFKDKLNFNTVIELLKANVWFREIVTNHVKDVAETNDLDV